MEQSDTVVTAESASQVERVIRCYPNVTKALMTLIFFAMFPALGLFMAMIPSQLGFLVLGLRILGFIIVAYFGLWWLAMWLRLFEAVFLRKPIVEFNASGITRWPLLSPWRHVTIPWEEVTLIGALYRGGGEKARPTFFIKTRHDEKYVSPIRQRFMRWWNPSLGIVAFSSSLPWMADASKLVARVETAFAPEIARYGITIRARIR